MAVAPANGADDYGVGDAPRGPDGSGESFRPGTGGALWTGGIAAAPAGTTAAHALGSGVRYIVLSSPSDARSVGIGGLSGSG